MVFYGLAMSRQRILKMKFWYNFKFQVSFSSLSSEESSFERPFRHMAINVAGCVMLFWLKIIGDETVRENNIGRIPPICGVAPGEPGRQDVLRLCNLCTPWGPPN